MHRKTVIRQWRRKYGAVADNLEETDDRLFTTAAEPMSQRVDTQCDRTTAGGDQANNQDSEPCCLQRTPLPCCALHAHKNLHPGIWALGKESLRYSQSVGPLL